MNKISHRLLLLPLMIVSSFTMAETITTQYTAKNRLILQSVDNNNFTGDASFSRFPGMPSNGDIAPAIVYFKPNSFTNWHSHSQGQYLIVTDGTGRFQEWDKPIQMMTKGDVIWIAPHVKHWHGAGEFTAMTHIAMSPVDNNEVTWYEKAQPEKTSQAVPVNKISERQFTHKQLTIVPLAIAITQGDSLAEKTAIEQALHAGLTVNELKEAVSHQFSYIGAPKTLNGVMMLKSVLEDRFKQGVVDPQGNLATELGPVDYYQLGEQKLAALTNRATTSAIFDFAPAIDYAIKAQLFGYQFSRDNLGDVDRELVTIGSLIGLGDSVNAQLYSHLLLLKQLGLTEEGLLQIASVITPEQSQNLLVVWHGITP